MKTVDSLMLNLENQGYENLNWFIPARDIKIMKNITELLKRPSYITENQGKLLIKILSENSKVLQLTLPELEYVLNVPLWGKEFRKILKIREVSIFQEDDGVSRIKIKYTFDKDVKKALGVINKNINSSGFVNTTNELCHLLLEKNIVEIYNNLKPLKFHFSSEFLDLHKKIVQFNKSKIIEEFEFQNFYDLKLKNTESPTINHDPLLILDRKIQYQYNFTHNFSEDEQKTLSYKIANRKDHKIFINQFDYNLSSLVQSLNRLERKKILVFFDTYSINECITNFKLVKNLVDDNNISNIGIYFRFDNKTEGINFNKLVAEYKFNKQLEPNTQIVGLSNGTLPKFLLKNDWYPDAVISFTNNLRNNRTDVYCNNCDLVIYYTTTKPLISYYDEIL